MNEIKVPSVIFLALVGQPVLDKKYSKFKTQPAKSSETW